MIRVCGLKKQYNDFVAVDGVSFDIGTGEICGLVGHNGAGKTTTMRCLSGLLRPDAGDLCVADCCPATQPVELKRRVVYVPDDPPLFDDLSVYDHFEFMGRIYQVANYHTIADDLLQQFGLIARRHHLARELSRGMRQKLAICLAYLVNPQVLLFDEPMTGLDPQGIRLFLETLRQRAQAGTTIVLSSHLLAMIQDVCSMVMVMHHGQVRFLGTRDELHARYHDAATLEEAFFEAISDNESISSMSGAIA